MRLGGKYLQGGVLPTVVVVSVVMLTALLGLLVLWEHEMLLFARSCRFRQARADVESAYTFYRLYPDAEELVATAGYRLYDSLPHSQVFVKRRPWGLYEAVEVCSADSLIRVCRLLGAEPDVANTLWYADNRSAVTVAGQTTLQGKLHLPQNGLVYGRVGSDFYRGAEIPRSVIRQAEKSLPAVSNDSRRRIRELLAQVEPVCAEAFGETLHHSFLADSTVALWVGNAEVGDCCLRGKIVLYADELRIDSTCRIEHLLVIARKITVGSGTRITAQLFARDTIIVEPRAVMEHPSGIYAGEYAQVGERAEVNGYAIVCDTVTRKKFSANYRQARTARLRGLLYVDGIAQVQGIVSGRAVLRQTAFFSPQGYYKDMFYDVTLLENPVTVQPLWTGSGRRKEAVCVD